MTNTDRSAQALRELIRLREMARCAKTYTADEEQRAWKEAAAAVASLAPAAVEGPLPPYGPEICPFTGRVFWGNIEHPELGVVATYGGPYDTYTLPQRDADDASYYVYRFDHDAGAWVDGVEDIGVAVVDDQLYTSEEDPAALTAQVAALTAQCANQRALLQRIRGSAVTFDQVIAWIDAAGNGEGAT